MLRIKQVFHISTVSIINLILLTFIIIPTVSAQFGGNKKKKNQEQYYSYEREDVNLYRDRVDFRMPEPKMDHTGEVENNYTQPVSLEYLFQGGEKVYIDSDYRLNQLLAVHKDIGRQSIHTDGFRIQIYAGRGETGARRTYARAMTLFPDHMPYFDFISPNYIVRVGDFMDKEDATLFTRKLREYFPDAFLVPSKVKIPKYRPEEENKE